MRFKNFVLSLVALALIIAGATIYLRIINEEKAKSYSKLEVPKVLPPSKPEIKKEPTEKKEVELPKLAIIIDDMGNSKELGEEVLTIKNVTIAIIPDLKYSLYFAKKGKELGKDILVHVPMEPKNKDNYSEDTKMLKTDMDSDEIRRLSLHFLNAVPYAKGANNHMGSKFTENREKIEGFFDVLKEKNLFFLDSRTTADSIAFKTGLDFGIKCYKRDVFLDHEISEDKISAQLDVAIAEAQKKGYAVAIGHPHQETINVLKRRYKELTRTVEIVPISKLQ